MRAAALRHGRWAFGLTLAALVWAIALIGAALLVPAYSGGSASSSGSAGTAVEHHTTSTTLVQENGWWVLIPVAVPAFLTVLVWAVLRLKCSRGYGAGDRVAWAAIAVLVLFSLLAAFSIGLFVLPVAVLLAIATALTPVRPTLAE